MHQPRSVAILFLLVFLGATLLLCRFFASRTPRPAVVWAAGGYWAFLHLLCLYGLLTGTLFDTALAQLTLFTFPISMNVGDAVYTQSFATLAGLAANYVRYVLLFGGLNALLIAGFLTLVVPGRIPPSRRASRRHPRPEAR